MPSNTEISLRKEDHLSMAQASQVSSNERDHRFFYEPMLSAHPQSKNTQSVFGSWSFDFPLWISSMTGGAQHAQKLNSIMASACEEFQLGMGLGSCRPMLEDKSMVKDFNVRHLMPTRPLFANFGIAQIESSIQKKSVNQIHDIVETLKADGLIIHVNPLQEWFQEGGDLISTPPIETVKSFLESASYPVIVKEVGHGIGPESLRALMNLNLFAIEFAAFGGTNFSNLEAKRSKHQRADAMIYVGHTAREMMGFVQNILKNEPSVLCQKFIVSGGIQSSLDGYLYTAQLPQSLFGMANKILQHALTGESALREYLKVQKEQYLMAQAFLKVSEE
jgi:isopentenyl-diphosphate Delta-isomerase